MFIGICSAPAVQSATVNNTSLNPSTGDNITYYAVMFGLSIIGFISLGIYTKKFN